MKFDTTDPSDMFDSVLTRRFGYATFFSILGKDFLLVCRRKGSVSISGSIHNVYLARQQLIVSLETFSAKK